MMRNRSMFPPRCPYSHALLCAVALIAALLPLSGALNGEEPAPWLGTWKLNLEKSGGNPGSRFKKVITRIESSTEGLKVTYDAIGVRGGVTHMEWGGKLDGRDYPVQGVDYVLTNAYTRVDDHAYQIVVKVDGARAATTTVSVSPDGKTLTTVTVEGTSSTRSVYDRQY
jgi:hypothetical protein